MSQLLPTREPFFGAPLARLHAAPLAGAQHPAWGWLIDRIRSASAGPPALFDIGCGDGGWLLAAQEAGIPGQGIDISPDFVELARRAGARVQQGSGADAAPPAGTTAITALGEVLAHEPAALAPAALNAARGLPPGGLLLFDLPGPDTPACPQEHAGPGWRLSVNTRAEGTRLTRRIQVETRDGLHRETHHLRLFSPDEARDILQGFGFEVTIHPGYGPCPLPAGRYVVEARKP